MCVCVYISRECEHRERQIKYAGGDSGRVCEWGTLGVCVAEQN